MSLWAAKVLFAKIIRRLIPGTVWSHKKLAHFLKKKTKPKSLLTPLKSTEPNVPLNLQDLKAVSLCSLARVIADSQLLSASPGKT